ncbi:MAG: recombinase family protein [Deltaproteobacteria bacterium]|nr:recombinase family protein [Deltaproteobacteria bacterium]
MTKPLCISYARFSTPAQRKGDSLRRQIDNAKKYAKENDFIFDKSYVDEGLSAYSGKHTSEGYLGKFLKMIKDGGIPKGTTLVIENLDRLSRQNITKALSQFLSIIDAGVSIHTLMDKQTYSIENIEKNQGMLFLSIGQMYRAHDESEAKSKRLKEVWEQKRKNALELKMPTTGRLPLWLKLNRKTMTIETIPQRAAIIQRIFYMAENGKGATTIIKTFNAEKIEPWGNPKLNNRAKQWHTSYITKIIKNKAVYGEYQPCRSLEVDVNGKSKIKSKQVGDPIANYYPTVISEELFNKVQYIRSCNRHSNGRIGKNKNLFTGLAFCGYCGGTFVSADRIKKEKTLRYLCCNNARLNNGCSQKLTSFPKIELEKAVLTYISEITINDLLVNGKDEKVLKLKTKESELFNIKTQIKEVDLAIKNYDAQLQKAPSEKVAELFTINLEKSFSKKEELEGKLSHTEQEIKTLRSEEKTTAAHLKNVKVLFKKLYTNDTNEDDTRFKLRSLISQVIDRIELFPDGLHDKIAYVIPNGSLKFATADGVLDGEKAEQYILGNTGRKSRTVHVYFKCGDFKEIRFNPMDGYFVAAALSTKERKEDEQFIINFRKTLKTQNFTSKEFGNAIALHQAERDKKLSIYHPDPELKKKYETIIRIVQLRNRKTSYKKMISILKNEGVVSFTGKVWSTANLSRVFLDYKDWVASYTIRRFFYQYRN